MEEKNINCPKKLQEFYVDSDEEELDGETLDEFNKILDAIKEKYPIYKSMEAREEVKVYEKKVNEMLFLYIFTKNIIIFTDFNDKKKEVVQENEERYNLNYIKPILIEVKRIQDKEPRGILCWSNQFKTHYNLVKIYNLNNKNYREEYEIENGWEEKGKEKEGEAHREELQREYEDNICSC